MRFIPLFAIILVGCSSHIRHSYQPLEKEEKSVAPELVFLTFHMHRDSISGKHVISLMSKTKTSGTLKPGHEKVPFPDRLVISILNTGKEVLITADQEHPLIRSIEAANPQGEFERKTVHLNDADFFVRMALPRDAAYVLIEEVAGGKKIASVDFSLH